MDLRVTASVYAPLKEWLNVGADYQYHRNTESLEFGTYGKSDKVYNTLIDYGTFMGLTEQFGNEGYTDKTHEMPLFEDAHQGALQIEVLPLPALSVLGSLSSVTAPATMAGSHPIPSRTPTTKGTSRR